MNYEQTIEKLKTWLNQNIPPDHKILVPISGGSDSALCLLLCSQVRNKDTVGIYIGTELRQQVWFESIGNIRYGNLKASSLNPEIDRWAYFLSMAVTEDRILIGSRNLTESTLGTYSSASRVASFLPLGNLWKHEVMELCNYLGVPDEIIKSSSAADPECGRPVELAAISFQAVDDFLMEKQGGIEARLDLDQRAYLEDLYNKNLYKSRLPLIGPSVNI